MTDRIKDPFYDDLKEIWATQIKHETYFLQQQLDTNRKSIKTLYILFGLTNIMLSVAFMLIGAKIL